MAKIEKQRKQIKLFKLIFVLSAFAFFGSLGFKIYVSNDLAVKNQDLRSVYDKQAALEEEISMLQYRDSQVSSIKYVEERALQMGYVPMKDDLISLDLHAPIQVASLSR